MPDETIRETLESVLNEQAAAPEPPQEPAAAPAEERPEPGSSAGQAAPAAQPPAQSAAQDDDVAPIREAMREARPYLQSLGVSPERAFRALLTADWILRHGTPAQRALAIQRMAADYRIALPESAPRPAVANEFGTDDPVAALHRDVQVLKNVEIARQHALAATAHNQARQQIVAFEAEKDADGKLAHPHFATVMPDIVRLATADRAAGRQPDLRQLYEQAIWGNPAVRAQLIAERNEAQRQQAASTRKSAARNESGGSIRAILKRAMAT